MTLEMKVALTAELVEVLQILVQKVDRWMDFGERPCQLCGHHYNHNDDCPYLQAKALIAKAKKAKFRIVGE